MVETMNATPTAASTILLQAAEEYLPADIRLFSIDKPSQSIANISHEVRKYNQQSLYIYREREREVYCGVGSFTPI